MLSRNALLILGLAALVLLVAVDASSSGSSGSASGSGRRRSSPPSTGRRRSSYSDSGRRRSSYSDSGRRRYSPAPPTTRRRRTYEAPGAACTASNFNTVCNQGTRRRVGPAFECCAATSTVSGSAVSGNCLYECTKSGDRDLSDNLVATSSLRPYALCYEINNATGTKIAGTSIYCTKCAGGCHSGVACMTKSTCDAAAALASLLLVFILVPVFAAIGCGICVFCCFCGGAVMCGLASGGDV